MALMLDRLKKDNMDPELYLQKMTRAHLNRGSTILFPRINDLTSFIDMIIKERGISLWHFPNTEERKYEAVKNARQRLRQKQNQKENERN